MKNLIDGIRYIALQKINRLELKYHIKLNFLFLFRLFLLCFPYISEIYTYYLFSLSDFIKVDNQHHQMK